MSSVPLSSRENGVATRARSALALSPGLRMRTLRTERLRLEPVVLATADDLWRILQQPGLRLYQELPDVSKVAFRELIGSRPSKLTTHAYGRFEWLIFLEGVRHPVGWVSLRIGDRLPRTGEVGYSILLDARNRGIATEALLALIAEAKKVAKLDAIRAYCVPENRASRRVLQKLGFMQDGILPHGASVTGVPVDVAVYLLPHAKVLPENP